MSQKMVIETQGNEAIQEDQGVSCRHKQESMKRNNEGKMNE